MIESTMFRRYSLEEKQTFTQETIRVVDPVLGELPEYKTLVAQIKADRDNMMKTTEGLNHPELTHAVNTGDNLRDGGIGGLKGNAKRSLNRTDPKWVAAGTVILQAFHDFGEGMATLSIAKETAAVERFLAEVDRNPVLRAAITTIQSDAWLQDMRDGQNMVVAAIDQRGVERAADTLPSTVEAAMPLVASIDRLFRYINMKLEVDPTPELVALSHRLNEIIARYKQAIKLRQTLREQEQQQKLDQK